MFKIPSYDELEKKEKEREAKNKEIKANLFEKRKLVSLDDSSSSQQARSSSDLSSSSSVSIGRSATTSTATGNQNSSPEKRPRIEAASVATASSASVNVNDDNDDDDSLLMAFIDEKKDIIDQSPKIVKTTNDAAVFKVPEAPPTSSISVSSAAPRILAPNANTNTNSAYGSGGALLVNSKQKGTFFVLFCF